MSTFTTKSGVDIFYKDWGSGEPVVFSHGWPLNADAWDVEINLVASAGYRVIAHDRRSHGRSSQTWNGNEMDTYADDLAELIESLDPRSGPRRPLHRRRRNHSVPGPPRHVARGQGRSPRRGPAPDAEDRRQSRGPSNPGLRHHPHRRRHRSLPVLQGPAHPLLQDEQARLRRVAGRPRCVLSPTATTTRSCRSSP
jgi:alpha/beta hydrolase family protein